MNSPDASRWPTATCGSRSSSSCCARGDVTFRWVKGHAGDPMNDLVDRLAVEAAQTQQGRSGDEPPTELGPTTTSAPRRAPRGRSRPASARCSAETRRRSGPRRSSSTAPGRPYAGRALLIVGHRPPVVDPENDPEGTGELLDSLVGELLAAEAEHPDLVVVTGLRQGAEQLAAEAAVGAGDALRRGAALARSRRRRGPTRRRERFTRAGRREADQMVAAPAPRCPTSPPRAGTAPWPAATTWLARNVDAAVAGVGRRRRAPSAALHRTPRRRSLGDRRPSGSSSRRACGCRERRCGSGSDTGGTFTDLVADDGARRQGAVDARRPGRGGAGRPRRAARRGERPSVLAHGTTVATNALLERRGARGRPRDHRGLRRRHRDRPPGPARRSTTQLVVRPEPLVPRELRFEVAGRLAADGAELDAARRGALPDHPRRASRRWRCACCTPTSSPRHETRRRPTALRAGGHDVTLLARGVARVPRVRAHGHDGGQRLPAARRAAPTCGGSPTLADDGAGDDVGRRAACPAAERRRAARRRCCCRARPAACWPAPRPRSANGFPDAVTFDMGGTSTDVCLVLGGQPAPAAEREVAGLPGAAAVARRAHHRRRRRLDRPHRRRRRAGRRARAAPGAVPGPACYGRGGTEPTVTDANLVAGRIPAGAAFPGLGALDLDAAAGPRSTAPG